MFKRNQVVVIAAQERTYKKQAALDAVYPHYAAMRKDYGPRESIEEGIARLQAAA